MHNLSEFKKYLANPAASVRMVSLEYLKNGGWESVAVHDPNFRDVAKLQTNAVSFKSSTGGNDSWLSFGRASEWAFDHSAGIAVNVSGGTRITYKWANFIIVENKGR